MGIYLNSKSSDYEERMVRIEEGLKTLGKSVDRLLDRDAKAALTELVGADGAAPVSVRYAKWPSRFTTIPTGRCLRGWLGSVEEIQGV